MQRIYEAADIIEASIVKGMLKQHRIQAFVGGFYLQGAIGGLPASGNTSIWVEDEDVSKAKAVIEEYQSADNQS